MKNLRLPMTYSLPKVGSHSPSMNADDLPRRTFGEWVDLKIPDISDSDAPIAAAWPLHTGQEGLVRHFDGQNYMRIQKASAGFRYDQLSEIAEHVCKLTNATTLKRLESGSMKPWPKQYSVPIETQTLPEDYRNRRAHLEELNSHLLFIDGDLYTRCHDPVVIFFFDRARPTSRLDVSPTLYKAPGTGHRNFKKPVALPNSWSIGSLETARIHNERWFGGNPGKAMKSLDLINAEVFTDDHTSKQLVTSVIRLKAWMKHDLGLVRDPDACESFIAAFDDFFLKERGHMPPRAYGALYDGFPLSDDPFNPADGFADVAQKFLDEHKEEFSLDLPIRSSSRNFDVGPEIEKHFGYFAAALEAWETKHMEAVMKDVADVSAPRI